MKLHQKLLNTKTLDKAFKLFEETASQRIKSEICSDILKGYHGISR